MIGGARADLHVLSQPGLMAVEQAAVILDVFARENLSRDLLRDAQEHVQFTLTVLNPEMKRFWLQVLWCLTSQGNA